MKQITLDWDTYQKELQDAELNGKRFGIYDVARFIRDEESAFNYGRGDLSGAWTAVRAAIAHLKNPPQESA